MFRFGFGLLIGMLGAVLAFALGQRDADRVMPVRESQLNRVLAAENETLRQRAWSAEERLRDFAAREGSGVPVGAWCPVPADLDAARRAGVRVEPADVPAGDRIPPQNLPTN